MPHGHRYLWTHSLVYTMVAFDLLICLAYASISICLYILVKRRRLPFSAIFLAPGMFIAALSTTHFMEVYNLWYSNYWLAAFIKVITANASVATSAIMFPLFPKVIELATAARLSEERKRQLEPVNHDLQIKTEQLTQTNLELEAFSYSVSHDLRTPLRGIDGFSRALIEDNSDQLPDKAKVCLGYMRSGAQRMGKIIDGLLNLSRMTRIELRYQKTSLTKIAEEIIQSLRKREPQRYVKFFIQAGLEAMGSAGLLLIALENFLANAWKFTSRELRARIEFGAMAPDGELEPGSGDESNEGANEDSKSRTSPVYFVRDNGIGFDMSYSHKLFSAFQRLHSEEEFAGTGVGLATVKRVIDRHSGTIRVESQPGKGTTVYFSLGAEVTSSIGRSR